MTQTGPRRPCSVVQFGAGSIGRGFMAQLFTEAGCEVVFVDVQPELVAAINSRRSYPLQLCGPTRYDRLTIEPVRAVDGRDLDAVATELARCSLACTAVGVPILPRLAPALAAGVVRRRTASTGEPDTLNVILCENQLRCSQSLRQALASRLNLTEVASIGLIESVVSRMVPIPTVADLAGDPLLVRAEDYYRLPIDADAIVASLPNIPALHPVSPFVPWVERKLYLHNMAHAITAYLGDLGGHVHVHEALADAGIRAAVRGAMDEAAEGLCRRHCFDRTEMGNHCADLMLRMANPELRDTVARVGRDPLRKLAPTDRLLGAANMCVETGVAPVQLCAGIAAALKVARRDPTEPQLALDLPECLERICGILPGSELAGWVSHAWDLLETHA